MEIGRPTFFYAIGDLLERLHNLIFLFGRLQGENDG